MTTAEIPPLQFVGGAGEFRLFCKRQKEQLMKKIPILGALAAALIASICCLGPAILATVGFGGAAWLAKSDRLFYILGLAVLAAAIFLLKKQRAGEACCPTETGFAKPFLKTFALVLFLGALFFGLQYGLTHRAASWLYKRPASAPPVSSFAKSRTASVSIPGMTCIACAKGIEAHLRQTRGVYDALVSFDKKKALVCYNPRQVSKNDIEKHIGETGYSGKIISETVCAKPGFAGNNL